MDSNALLTTDPSLFSSASSREDQNVDFQYRPLDHSKQSIRLIKILPDLSPDGMIKCEMWHAPIQSRYQCLSYRWGSPADPRTVLIKDIQSTNLEERSCTVGQSLYDFLNAARGHAGLGDTFWIDALCIDQNNGPERNHQVTQMGNIYSQANLVVIWLGNYSKPYHKYGDRYYDDTWDELGKNEYWTRAWIAQEFVLARNINFLIGNTLVPYSEIRSGSGESRIYDLIVARNRYEKVRDSLWHRFWLEKTSLWGDFFILEARLVQCAIPRDRIFAFLALLKEGDQIMVDYQIPAYELAYHLIKLNTGFQSLNRILKLLHLIRDEGDVSTETIGVAGHFVEFQVFFKGLESRATEWVDEYRLSVVDILLEGKGLGSVATIHGRGFTITRKDGQSLMLNVRVALSTLSNLLDSFDPWPIHYLPVVEDPRFDAEFQAWAESSLFHRVYRYMFGKTHWRTKNEWAALKIGYEPTPNQKSIPYNLIIMGGIAACRC
jgi:hypothetical protein